MEKRNPPIYKVSPVTLAALAAFCGRQVSPRIKWTGEILDTFVGLGTAVGLYTMEEVEAYAQAKEILTKDPVDVTPSAGLMARIFVTANTLRRSRLGIRLGFSGDFKEIAQAIIDFVSYSGLYSDKALETFVALIEEIADLQTDQKWADAGLVMGGFDPLTPDSEEAATPAAAVGVELDIVDMDPTEIPEYAQGRYEAASPDGLAVPQDIVIYSPWGEIRLTAAELAAARGDAEAAQSMDAALQKALEDVKKWLNAYAKQIPPPIYVSREEMIANGLGLLDRN